MLWKREQTKAELAAELARCHQARGSALRLIESIREVLKRCEWHESNGGETCPYCLGEKPGTGDEGKGHTSSCLLAAHLRGAEGDA